jgi:hypothetical protein
MGSSGHTDKPRMLPWQVSLFQKQDTNWAPKTIFAYFTEVYNHDHNFFSRSAVSGKMQYGFLHTACTCMCCVICLFLLGEFSHWWLWFEATKLNIISRYFQM